MKHTAIFVALAGLLAVPAAGQSSPPSTSQAAVLADEAVPPPPDVRTIAHPRIASGKRITVELHKNLGGRVKGTFVGSDADGISVRTNKGQVRTVAWESVRSIKPRPNQRGLWIGMAAGAAFAGIALLSDDAPAELGFAAASIAAGAGVGGLAGATVDPVEPTIYEAPAGEDPASPR